jgi:O-antigen ligase
VKEFSFFSFIETLLTPRGIRLTLLVLLVCIYGLSWWGVSQGEFDSYWIVGLLSIGAFILTLFSPFSVFVLFLGSIPIEIVSLVPSEAPLGIRPYLIFAFFAFVGWILVYLRKRHIMRFPFFTLVDLGLILIVVGSFVSAFFSEHRNESFRLSVVLLFCVFLYGIVRLFVTSGKEIKEGIPYVIGGFFLTSVYGIFQNFAFLRGWIFHNEVMPGRPNAFFSEADWLGFFVVLMIVVCEAIFLSLFLGKPTLHKRQKKMGIFCLWGMLVLGYILLIISVSRSAWLAFFFGSIVLGIVVFLRYKKKVFRPLFLIGGGFVLSLVYVFIIPLTNFELSNRAQSSVSGFQMITISCVQEIVLPDRIEVVEDLGQYGCRHILLEERESEMMAGRYVIQIPRKDPNANIRKNVWNTAMQTLANNPIVGVGWGSNEKTFGLDPRGEQLNASNIIFAFWLGSGILGLLGLSIIVFWLFVRGIRLVYIERDGYGFFVGVLILISLVVVGVFNMFNASEFLAFLWVWLGMMVAVNNIVILRS